MDSPLVAENYISGCRNLKNVGKHDRISGFSLKNPVCWISLRFFFTIFLSYTHPKWCISTSAVITSTLLTLKFCFFARLSFAATVLLLVTAHLISFDHVCFHRIFYFWSKAKIRTCTCQQQSSPTHEVFRGVNLVDRSYLVINISLISFVRSHCVRSRRHRLRSAHFLRDVLRKKTRKSSDGQEFLECWMSGCAFCEGKNKLYYHVLEKHALQKVDLIINFLRGPGLHLAFSTKFWILFIILITNLVWISSFWNMMCRFWYCLEDYLFDTLVVSLIMWP